MIERITRKYTVEELDAAKSAKGAWDRATLAAWGVPWPPPLGWKQMLIDGAPIPLPGKDGVPATAQRPSDCPEAKLLHQVVMSVIEAGHGDVLKSIHGLNAYYGFDLPTVSDVIGGQPAHAIIKGDITFDDKVYSFTCARSIHSPPKPDPSAERGEK
jgi:hypothetical protein